MKEKIQSKRLISLDLFRSIAIGGMVLVNNNGGEGAYSQLRHSRWHGVTFADFVFPFFLWIAGVSVVLFCERRVTAGVPRLRVFGQAARRSLFLILLGLFLAGFPRFDLDHLRFLGILQRIGICTLIAAGVHLYFNRTARVCLVGGCLLIYTALMQPGGYERGTNLANRIDAAVLGSHNARDTVTWDTEGLLSTLPALATCLIGASAGRRLLLGAAVAVPWLLSTGTVLTILGAVAAIWQPLNKSLWTPSYTLLTAGVAAILLGALCWAIDLLEWRPRLLLPLEILGRYALPVYVFHDFFATALRRISRGGISLDDHLRSFWTFLNNPANARLGYACSHLLASLVLALVLSRYYRQQRSMPATDSPAS